MKTNKTQDLDPIYTIDGTVLPSAKDMEEAVLGAIILESDAIVTVDAILPKKECFYTLQHQHIYSAILELRDAGEPIDMLTVVSKIKEKKLLDVVTPHYIAQLTNKVNSSANIEYHARIVAQKYLERESLIAYESLKQETRSGDYDIFQMFDRTIDRFDKLFQSVVRKSAKSFKEVLNEVNTAIIHAQPNAKNLTGITSGLYELDKRHGGWQNNNLIIIGARPGMGKSALTLAMAMKQAKSGKRVGFFSLEMSAPQLINRILSSETGIEFEKIKTKNLSKHEKQVVDAHVKEIENCTLLIDDSAPLNINEIRSTAKLWKAKFDVEIIYIDYLQLINSVEKSGNREQEVSKISRSLKLLAKELNIPVICLAQLSRTVESRSDKHPVLSDLRESGAIEMDSDVVIFLYRQEYYQQVEDSEKGKLEICTAKFRDGEIGIDFAKFDGHTQRIYDWNSSPEPPRYESNKTILNRQLRNPSEPNLEDNLPF